MVDEAEQKPTKPGEEQSAEEEIAKIKKKPLLLFIIIGVVAVLAISGAVYAITKSSKATGKKAAAKGAESSAKVTPEDVGPTFSLGSFVFNLADMEERRYLKATIEIEVADAKLVPQVEARLPKLKDAMILLISSKTSSELLTPEGQMLLRQQISKRLSEILGEGVVKDIYLTEFLIQ